MIRWTRALIDETAAAFNAGESQPEIAKRLQTSRGAVCMALCRARKLGVPVVRRCGTRKKGQLR